VIEKIKTSPSAPTGLRSHFTAPVIADRIQTVKKNGRIAAPPHRNHRYGISTGGPQMLCRLGFRNSRGIFRAV